MASDVHVLLDLGHCSLEFQGSQAFFDRWIEPLVAAACRTTDEPGAPEQPASPGPEAAAAGDDAPPSFQPSSSHFASFLQQIGPRATTPEQQAMAFAYFLWNYERHEEFGPEELAGCFRAVGLDVPDDLDDRLVTLRDKQRFVGSAEDDPARFVLTTKGRNYVKNRLLG